MNIPDWVRPNGAAFITVAVAHVLAWAAALWLTYWPSFYQGVSETPIQVDEKGVAVNGTESEVVRLSMSIVEANGFWVLMSLFIPVLLTGVALLYLSGWGRMRTLGTLTLGVLAAAMTAYSLLGIFSIGLFYLPATLALIVAAIVFNVRHSQDN